MECTDQGIVTARLRLRDFAVRDAAILQTIMARPGVPDWLKIAHASQPWEVFWQALCRGRQQERRYTVTGADDDRLIGLVGLSGDGRLHYLIDPDHWGRGLATEAVGAVLPSALSETGIDVIEAEVFDANPASARVLKKLGFDLRRRGTAQRLGGLDPEPSTIYGLDRAAYWEMA